MAIKSKELCREYKTMAAYKGQYTRVRKQITDHIDELKQCKAKGWRLYLGDPLLPQLYRNETDLSRLDNEYMKITGINTNNK